jgi:hypothetical protein
MWCTGVTGRKSPVSAGRVSGGCPLLALHPRTRARALEQQGEDANHQLPLLSQAPPQAHLMMLAGMVATRSPAATGPSQRRNAEA